MKTIKTSVLLIITLAIQMSLTAFATTPEQLSYQAVIKDASNNLVVNHAIGLQISILQTTSTGTVVYSETQTPTSNSSGLVSVAIGTGTVVSGTFATINWSTGTYFIKSEIDPAGGTSYTVSGTTQLQSVPYALHAKTVDGAFSGSYDDLTNKPAFANTQWTTTGSDIYYNAGKVGIGTTTPAQKLHLYSDATSKVVYSLFETTDGVESVTGYIGSDIRTNSPHAGVYKGFKILNIAGEFPLVLSNSANQALIFGTNDTERMRISATGNVGIGTTTPAYKLDISSATGSGRQDMLRILAGSNSTGNGASIVLGSTQTHAGYISGFQTTHNTGDLAFGTQSNGNYAENMRIVGSNGNVGIGTTTPASKLHIAGADMNNALLFENTSANPGRNYILFKTQGTEQGYIGLGGGATVHLITST